MAIAQKLSEGYAKLCLPVLEGLYRSRCQDDRTGLIVCQLLEAEVGHETLESDRVVEFLPNCVAILDVETVVVELVLHHVFSLGLVSPDHFLDLTPEKDDFLQMLNTTIKHSFPNHIDEGASWIQKPLQWSEDVILDEHLNRFSLFTEVESGLLDRDAV